ncbi:MAG TPA: SRPBCC domain-containing protein [Candidatus Dormibacteraeota bacterium]|nr:SRPBCC domain-containing protein [Candidatus Dormibacteraeota bacterium]
MIPIKEIEFERTYDAPIEVVWQAWTDPEHLKAWWGPDNVSIPECEVDLTVGGRIYIVMEAGEAMGPYKGTRWPMEGKFTVVEKNSKLTYAVKAWTEGQEETTEIDQVTELTLTDNNGNTKLKLKATINKTGPDAKMALEGMEYGFNQQLDKLSKFLGK